MVLEKALADAGLRHTAWHAAIENDNSGRSSVLTARKTELISKLSMCTLRAKLLSWGWG